jgi:uncharacterized membrane protein
MTAGYSASFALVETVVLIRLFKLLGRASIGVIGFCNVLLSALPKKAFVAERKLFASSLSLFS